MSKVGRPAGSPKTGGRQAGTPNKRTRDILEILDKANYCPITTLMWVEEQAREIFEMRKRNTNWSGALVALDQAESAASEIAQYTLPKKKAVEHSGEVGVKTFVDFIKAAKDKK